MNNISNAMIDPNDVVSTDLRSELLPSSILMIV